MEDHYVCKGTCGGVSDKPGVCQTEGCPNQGMPLEMCGCGNPKSHAKRREDKREKK